MLGEVDMALGGDQGGSVRMPASWSGCVGLKPTFGLVPCTGSIGKLHSLPTCNNWYTLTLIKLCSNHIWHRIHALYYGYYVCGYCDYWNKELHYLKYVSCV